MEENEIIETDTELVDDEAGQFLVTAVIFGTGALTGVLAPKVWRATKNFTSGCRDGVRAKTEELRSKRENAEEEK